MLIEMTIKGLMVDPITNMPIVILKDKEGERVLPIWVGIFEANAIALQIENIATPRPMTHDLLRNVITDLDGRSTASSSRDLKDNTFYAIIHLTVRGERVVDRRAAERRDRAGAADAVADPGGGDGHRQREDGRLRVGARRQRSAAEVAREPRSRGARQVQDVDGSREFESAGRRNFRLDRPADKSRPHAQSQSQTLQSPSAHVGRPTFALEHPQVGAY